MVFAMFALFFVLLLGGWAHRLIERRDFSEETARD